MALRASGGRRKPGDPADARDALAGFGADFLRQSVGKTPNTAISPYSLFTVLAMARAGAKSTTAAQIDAALKAEGGDAQGSVISAVDAGIAEAIAASKNAGTDVEPMVIQAANQVWVQNGFQVRQEYLDALAAQYGVEAMAADFAADPEKMRAAINSWVSERTNKLIPELFGQDTIPPDVLVVLVNALYLKARWQLPFGLVDPAPFTTAAGSTVQATMMLGPKPMGGTIARGWTSATIPYSGGRASMTLLVPDAGRFPATLAALDPAMMAAAGRTTSAISLTMPRFSMTTAPDAMEIAKKLGIVDLFGPADLSGIAGAPGELVASAFVHQAVVTVDQNGTEAAAASGIGIRLSLPHIDMEMTVDRPFLFWISENRTGAPLFLGTVTDPTA
jgi:serpin B